MGDSSGERYSIFVGRRGEATVKDARGKAVWSHSATSKGVDAESACDALVEALSWTAQRHTGHIVVEVPERGLANELVGATQSEHESRLSSILDDARVLLTWFESTDVALRDDAQAA